MRELGDDEIIAARKTTPSDYSRPWGDTLAFARAILAAAQAAMPPREPTQAMIDAGEKRRREIDPGESQRVAAHDKHVRGMERR